MDDSKPIPEPINEKLAIFANIPIFKGINAEQINNLFQLSEEIVLKEGEFLFHERDIPKDLFIIVSGTLEIVKIDQDTKTDHQLAVLKPGETIGEMSFIENKPRSSSVRAITSARLIKCSFTHLLELTEKYTAEHNIYYTLAKNLSERLRLTNKVTIHALRERIKEYKLRVLMSNFFIYLISLACIFTFALAWLNTLTKRAPSTSFITIFLTIASTFACYIILKFIKIPYSALGLTLRAWRKSLREGVLFTLPILAFILLIKWVLISTETSMQGKPLFEPFLRSKPINNFHGFPLSRETVWFLTLLLYCFIISPLQEFIARGTLQSSLQVFLAGKYKNAMAIVISNVLFSTWHLIISVYFALISFVPGLFWGWLYQRDKNLLGVWISHLLMGVWAYWVVGFY